MDRQPAAAEKGNPTPTGRIAAPPREMPAAWALVMASIAMAFLPTVGLASSGTASGSGALSARASIDFAIRVPRIARLRQLDLPRTLTLTEEDIARGFVRLRGRLDLAVNDPRGYVLTGRLADRAFSGFRVEGLALPIESSGPSDSVQMPPERAPRSGEPREVRYELRIAPGAVPGVRPWPLQLRVEND